MLSRLEQGNGICGLSSLLAAENTEVFFLNE